MILHMDTEEVLRLFTQMRKNIEVIKGAIEDIGQTKRSLRTAWYGGDSSATFVDDLESVVRNLEGKLDRLHGLSTRLNNEVDQWIFVDSQGPEIQVQSPGNLQRVDGYNRFALMGWIFGYSLGDVSDYLLDSESGKQLEALAKEAGLCFKLPDGTIIGDPNGEVITIRFGETDENALGYYMDSNKEIVISDSLPWDQKGKDVIAAIMAHEMQHAIDYQQEITFGFDLEGITDIQQMEEAIENSLESRIASEVRAFERTENMLYGTEYVDDGITSAEELRKIVNQYGYEQVYESQLNNEFAGRYTVDVMIIEPGGELDIVLTPIDQSRLTAFA